MRLIISRLVRRARFVHAGLLYRLRAPGGSVYRFRRLVRNWQRRF